MKTLDIRNSVKVVGANGQISLGKEFAGKQVMVEEREQGVWLVRTVLVIPENESWLHEPQAKRDLQEAIAWAANHQPQESDLDATLEKLNHGKQSKSRAAGPQ